MKSGRILAKVPTKPGRQAGSALDLTPALRRPKVLLVRRAELRKLHGGNASGGQVEPVEQPPSSSGAVFRVPGQVGSRMDLTGLTGRNQPSTVSRVAPRSIREDRDGARPLLENSTACRKLVPLSITSSCNYLIGRCTRFLWYIEQNNYVRARMDQRSRPRERLLRVDNPCLVRQRGVVI
jgi:hypothetical protein